MLRKRHSQEQRDWREERKGLVHLVNTRGGSQEGDDAGSLQIPLVEEKIREVLAMLRTATWCPPLESSYAVCNMSPCITCT